MPLKSPNKKGNEKADVKKGKADIPPALQVPPIGAVRPVAMKPVPPPQAMTAPIAPIKQIQPSPAAQTRMQPGGIPAPKEAGSLSDSVLKPFNGMLNFLGKRIAPYYLKLLKIEVLNLAVAFALGLVFAIFFVLLLGLLGGFTILGIVSGLGALMASLPLLIISALLLLIAIFVISWAQNSVQLTSILYTDSEMSGRTGFSIIENAKAISGKIFRYVIVNLALVAVLCIPAILILLVGFGGSLMSMGSSGGSGSSALLGLGGILLSYVLLFVYGVIALVLFQYFTQFWVFEMLIANRGVVDALKRSIMLACRKPVETILFDILFVVGLAIVTIPLFIVSFIIGLIFTLVQLALGVLSGPVLGIVVMLLMYFIRLVLNILIFTGSQAYSVPTRYLFWKGIKDTV